MMKAYFRIMLVLAAAILSAAPALADLWNVNDNISYTLSNAVWTPYGYGGLFTITDVDTGAVIETFFRALKQNLKIKTFVGTSANAVKTQIWTALIAMLILRFLQLRSKFNCSLSNLVALLRMNLFTHRNLWGWLNDPFETPPIPYEPEQLQFCLR